MEVNKFNDSESARQQRNMTKLQRKNNDHTKEGVLVNNFIKDCPTCQISIDDTRDSLIISDRVKLPSQIKESAQTPEKSLLPLSAAGVGVMGVIAGISYFAKRNAKISTEIAKEKWIAPFTRNISIGEEAMQAIVQMVISPNKRTVIAGVGVLTLTAMAYMGKTFFDGFKDIWVRKKEADIQKNLQENLIDVETQSFSGKIQITRHLLSEKAKTFTKYLAEQEADKTPFGRFKNNSNISFGIGDVNQHDDKKKSNNFNLFLLGIGTIVSIIGLGFFALKNVRGTKEFTNKYYTQTKDLVEKIAENNPDTIKAVFNKTEKSEKSLIQNYMELMLESINASKTEIEEIVKKTNWSPEEQEAFIQKVSQRIETSTVKVNPNIGGEATQKPAFNSFVNDYRAFFYNFLIEPKNEQFQQLFYGTTALAALSYGGKLTGDAYKDVQVKKYNAQTELELQKRLVSTELRNFKSKKDAAILPLMEEFYKQAQSGKPKEELKTIADNILFEIKNGPPFVYA